jgi:inosine/xanthosine triphosphate pyrophosphatase family protein
MKILIGTKNSAKFNRYKTILSQMPDLEVLSLRDIYITLPIIIEDGMTAEENASKKARAYAKSTRLPTLSVDEALYMGGLSPEQQPGTNVRRYMGKELTDDELLNLY